MKENHESVNVKLSKEDIERIRKVADEAAKAATGDRYSEGFYQGEFERADSIGESDAVSSE